MVQPLCSEPLLQLHISGVVFCIAIMLFEMILKLTIGNYSDNITYL